MVGEFEVLDSTGNTKTIWDTALPEQVEEARRTFNNLRAKRYIAFAVNESGEQGKPMGEFDPQAGKMIMVPPVVGG